MKVHISTLEPWNPFCNVVWASLDRSITKEEVQQAIDANNLRPEPVENHLDVNTPREEHIKRVAYLALNGWNDNISIDVGVPEMSCHVSWIVCDGNHRLAAAFFRGDEYIDCDISGSVAYAKELLGA